MPETKIFNRLIFKDKDIEVIKLCRVKASLWDKGNKVLAGLLSGQVFNYKGVSSFFSYEGKRLTKLNFGYLHKTNNGLFCVYMKGKGYKLIDYHMNILPDNDIYYDFILTDDFADKTELIAAKRNEQFVLLNKKGREIPIKTQDKDTHYTKIEMFCEGLAKVSTLDLKQGDLAYFSEFEDIAGYWGFINEKGEEVISPQYIYAYDFSNDRAIVCKGKWTTENYHGKYWTEEELWGVIDKSGKEIIPCQYNEIQLLKDDYNEKHELYQVHIGDWKTGKWAIADKNGKWLTPPIFEDYCYILCNDFLEFYITPENTEEGSDMLYGVYDLKNGRVLFEPQFYDIHFNDNDTFTVQVYDELLKEKIYKIIDIKGNEILSLPGYSFVYYTDNNQYIKVSSSRNGEHFDGLLDKYGKVVVPCVQKAEFYTKEKLYVYWQNNLAGLKDFDGNTLLEPQYFAIHLTKSPFIEAATGNKDEDFWGVITKNNQVVIPIKYKHISFIDDNKILAVYENKNTAYTDIYEYKEGADF